MKIKEGQKIKHPDFDYTMVCLSEKIDGPKGYLYGFFGGEKDGKYHPVFFGLKFSEITKANGYSRAI